VSCSQSCNDNQMSRSRTRRQTKATTAFVLAIASKWLKVSLNGAQSKLISNLITEEEAITQPSQKMTIVHAILFSSLLVATFKSAQSVDECPEISIGERCPAGCWLMDPEPSTSGTLRCYSVGFGHFSADNDNSRQKCLIGSYSDIEYATVCQKCETGSYSPTEGATSCQLCPVGSYSAVLGAHYCRTCRDDYYDQDGANAAELWEDEYYCVHVGPLSASAASYNSPSTSPSQIHSSDGEHSAAPSLSSTVGMSTLPSLRPSRIVEQATSSTPVQQEEIVITSHELYQKFPVCSNQEDHFQWHSQCKQCPSGIEEGFYPFFIVILLAALITVLQSLLPLCSTSVVWIGVDYLQFLYLIELVGIRWPPLAEHVFGKFVPVFALDINANFSFQCMFGWPKEYDQILMISLPLIFWLCATALARISNNRIVAYDAGLRWLVVLLYMGFTTLIQTSKDAATSVVSARNSMTSISICATIVGFSGLLFYGVVFQNWLHRALHQYYRQLEDHESAQGCDPEGPSLTSPTRLDKHKSTENDNSRRKRLFMTLGVFPSIQHGAWWWSIFWLMRKAAFIVVMSFFPESPFGLLVTLVVILSFSEIYKRRVVPFPNECEARLGNKWFHAASVDKVLQFCLILTAGLSNLVLRSEGKRSPAHDLTLDIMLLILIGVSVSYWTLSIGFASVHCCADCPRFVTEAGSLDRSLQTRIQSPGFSGSHSSKPMTKEMTHNIPISHRPDPRTSPMLVSMSCMAPNGGSYDIEASIVLAGSLVAATHNQSLEVGRESKNVRDSIISNVYGEYHPNGEYDEDSGTFLEEVWINSEVGEKIDNNSNS
jgi:hypothetical protein